LFVCLFNPILFEPFGLCREGLFSNFGINRVRRQDIQGAVFTELRLLRKAGGFKNQLFSPMQGTAKSLGFENCASQRHHLQILYIKYQKIWKIHKDLLFL
jgi:hypothetical protein